MEDNAVQVKNYSVVLPHRMRSVGEAQQYMIPSQSICLYIMPAFVRTSIPPTAVVDQIQGG